MASNTQTFTIHTSELGSQPLEPIPPCGVGCLTWSLRKSVPVERPFFDVVARTQSAQLKPWAGISKPLCQTLHQGDLTKERFKVYPLRQSEELRQCSRT